MLEAAVQCCLMLLIVSQQRLEAAKKPIIAGVRPNPEPRNLSAFQESKGAIATCHADGINGLVSMHSLKIQAWMRRIVTE